MYDHSIERKQTTIVKKQTEHKGQLKLFFSYSPKTGATSDMLGEARELSQRGYGVIISLVRSPETGQAQGIPFDLGYFLSEAPDLVVIDDLAYDNPEGATNKHRWQDVEELLQAGIDVFATMHVGNLESEKDRVSQITGQDYKLIVPERFFYGCDQLEFVDIDPKELKDRLSGMGVESYDLVQLKELRALALRCVSEYASRSSQKESKRRLLRSLDEKVLALIYLDGADEVVIHEAARISEALEAPLKVLYVDRATANLSSETAAKKEAALSSLQELTENLEGDFVVLNGEDVSGVAADYIQTNGITDVVMSRTPLSAFRRMFLPIALPRADKIATLLPSVHIHSVPRMMSMKKYKLQSSSWGSAFSLRLRDGIFIAVAIALSTLIIKLLSTIGFSNQTSVLVYVLASSVVARFTKGYLPGVLCTLISTAALSYFFVRPYYSFAVEHKANYVTFVIMILVSLIITTLASRMQRDSLRARYREQHTQALYELNKNLLHSRGMFDVVSTALETVTRLFDKAAVIYLEDPYKEGSSKMRAASSDVNINLFTNTIEKEAAKRCLDHLEETGFGTDVLSTADALYVPISSSEESRAVLGLSMRTGGLNVDDKSFLLMIVNQIALAFERQLFIDEHRSDLQEAELGLVRARFAQEIVNHASLSSMYINELARKVLSSSDEEAEIKEQYLHLLAAESRREHHFTEGLALALSEKSGDKQKSKSSAVGLGYLVRAAVDKVREKQPRALIALELHDIDEKPIVDKRIFISSLSHIIKYMVEHNKAGKSVQVSMRTHSKGPMVSLANDQDGRAVELLNTIFSSSYLNKREQMFAAGPRLRRLDASLSTDSEVDLVMAAAAIRAHGGKLRARKRIGGGIIVSLQLPK